MRITGSPPFGGLRQMASHRPLRLFVFAQNSDADAPRERTMSSVTLRCDARCHRVEPRRATADALRRATAPAPRPLILRGSPWRAGERACGSHLRMTGNRRRREKGFACSPLPVARGEVASISERVRGHCCDSEPSGEAPSPRPSPRTRGEGDANASREERSEWPR